MVRISDRTFYQDLTEAVKKEGLVVVSHNPDYFTCVPNRRPLIPRILRPTYGGVFDVHYDLDSKACTFSGDLSCHGLRQIAQTMVNNGYRVTINSL